jgi:hypothetical protein
MCADMVPGLYAAIVDLAGVIKTGPLTSEHEGPPLVGAHALHPDT